MHELDARGAPGVEAIATASLSDAGRVRAENQDAIALIANTSGERLFLVADGMGGHRGGETASKICLKTIERVFREPHGTPEQRLIRGIELANEEVYSHALANPELRGMGTTAVVVLLAPGGAGFVAWVGDSRLYRLRAGELEQLTQDHSLMAEWITIGVITADAARTHPRRHELTRALGQTPDVVVDLAPIEIRPGDRLLLCSDGLHGCVPDSVLARALATGVPDVAACALVDAANENGGPDNVSVIIAAVPDPPEPVATREPEAAPEPAGLTSPDAVTAPWPEAEPEPGLEASSEPEPEAVPEPGPDLGFEPPLEFARDPVPEPAREMEPESAPGPGPDLGFEHPLELARDLAPAPEPEPPPAACAPEIAAELGALGANETLSEPEPPGVGEARAVADVHAETSFADLGAELVAEAAESVPESEPHFEPPRSFERERFPTPSAPIQIPLMTPVRSRRRLDATSLVVGVTTTLVTMGLGFAVWSYTAGRSTQAGDAARPPKVVHAAPSRPAPRPPVAPAPKPIERPVDRPIAKPEIAPTPQPVVARAPEPTPVRPAPPVPPAPVAKPAPQAAGPSTAPSVPAALDPSAEQQASVAKFELTPAVERFLTAWLGALATDDRARLAALGFPAETKTLAGTPGSRDGFRLVAADIDEERSQGSRVYLRLIVSYAFTDASGRFRTQDEQRMILNDVGGRLRFEGRWQQ